MRPGLEGTSNRNYGAWVTSRNWVRHALARPMFAAPGEEMEYSTGNTHLLSAILTKVSGGEHLAVCQRRPGQTARLHAAAVASRSSGHLLRRQRHAADAAADGCVRRAVPEPGTRQRPADRRGAMGGAVVRGDGRAIASRAVSASIRIAASSIRCAIASTDTAGGCIRSAAIDTCFAWGYGGQYIFVLPQLELVMVTTSSPDVSEERRGHRREPFRHPRRARRRACRRREDLAARHCHELSFPTSVRSVRL